MKQPNWTQVRDLEEAFEDIRIVDLDAAKTTWSRVHMLDEVQTHQLPDVEKSIRFANAQSRVLRDERRAERQTNSQAVLDEREQLAALRGEIRRRASEKKPALVEPRRPDAPQPAAEPPASGDADLDARLNALRAQFRSARTSQKPETDRGDD